MTEKLEALNRAIKSAERQIAEEERQAEEETKKEERAESKFWQREERKLAEKLRLAEDIFHWSRKFCRGEEYQKLLKIRGARDYLPLYCSWWGHKREGRGFGCVSQLYLRKDGTFYYNTRYKWFPYSYKRTFKTARELAKGLIKDYLKELHRFIATGLVYEELRKEVEEALE
jgi:hypothetical protein